MKIHKVIFFVCLVVAVSLSGCASMNSDFECPLRPGIKCKSVDEINDLIDQGGFSIKNKRNFSSSICIGTLPIWIA